LIRVSWKVIAGMNCLVDEGLILRNKLEFLQIELRDLTAAINRMSHKKRVVTNKADEVARQASEEREAQSAAAQDFIRTTRQV
jgi:mannitol-specific phosphotransferase system IIBC component